MATALDAMGNTIQIGDRVTVVNNGNNKGYTNFFDKEYEVLIIKKWRAQDEGQIIRIGTGDIVKTGLFSFRVLKVEDLDLTKLPF